ncbi:MAG: hypothetical protein IJB59_11490 [Oscillospiraceae bacterium]|nr:hypothetical protein [Oscillospiraceae bacterium]
MDMLKHLPGFRRYWQRKTGQKTSRNFPVIAAELQELGNVFTAQGRSDAAAGEESRFSDVYFMIVAADPAEDSPLSNLMRLCYEEGYNESV